MGSVDHLYRNTLGSIDSNSQKRAGVKIDKNKVIQYLTAFAQDNVDQNYYGHGLTILVKRWIG